MAQVGRISGPLLKSNLERHGIDLAFKDVSSSDPVLFLDVNNNRIGINYNGTPLSELYVPTSIKTTETIIQNTAQFQNWTISPNGISQSSGDINIAQPITGTVVDIVPSSVFASGSLFVNKNPNNGRIRWGHISDSGPLNSHRVFGHTADAVGGIDNQIWLGENLNPGQAYLGFALAPYYHLNNPLNTNYLKTTFPDGTVAVMRLAAPFLTNGTPGVNAQYAFQFYLLYTDQTVSTNWNGDTILCECATEISYSGPGGSVAPPVRLTGFGTGTSSQQFLAMRDNNIGSVSNSNIVLDPAGTGTTEFFANTTVDGSITATGNIRADGNLTLGSGDEDDILLKADIAVDIVPDATNTYKIGQSGKQFNEFFGSNITMDFLNGKAIQASGSSTPQPGSSTVQNLGLDIGNTFYVARNGADTDGGFHPAGPFLTLKRALDAADASTQGPVTIRIAPGEYEEITPLVVPSNVTIIGEDMRNVKVKPASAYLNNDVFHLNGETTVQNLTVTDFYYDSGGDTGYAFRFAPNSTITKRSPYIQNITVITQGTPITVTASSTFSVLTQENQPRGITFNNDGTKMFIVGTTGDDVNEYTLSTGFDLSSTVTFVDSFSVSAKEGGPTAVKFNTDGTKMFITGVSSSNVHEYALSTGFDVSTASFTQTLVTTVDNDNFGLDFSADGTKMYITGNQNDKIYEYNLSSAFDISTATFNQDKYLNPIDDEPFGIEFNTDGTRLFIVGTKGNGVDEYTLSTPYDISTMMHMGFYHIGNNPSGIHINPAGTKMFIIGNQSDIVKSYDLGTPYRVSQDSDPRGFDSGNAGKGALVDGASVLNTSEEASMLFHSVTFITPGVDALTCTNGVRVEWLNCFTYFANIGIHCKNGSTGHLSSDGSTTKYGAELRSIASACVYGNTGIKGDGADVLVYAINHNFAYIGSGRFVDNDPSRAIQSQEVVKANSAKVYFSSQDHIGNFRVGDAFHVNQEDGTTSLNLSSAEFANLNSLILTTDGNSTELYPDRIEVGDFRLSGQKLETVNLDLNLNSFSNMNMIKFLDNVNMEKNFILDQGISIGGGFAYIGEQINNTLVLGANIGSNLEPSVSGKHDLGTSALKWGHGYFSQANIADINILDNRISTSVSNADLELVAHGTGKVFIPSNTLEVKALTTPPTGTMTFNNFSTQGITSTGDIIVNQNYTFNDLTPTTMSINGPMAFSGLTFDMNNIRTLDSNSDLELRSAGTGDVLFSNNTNFNNDVTVNGTLKIGVSNFTRVTADFSTGDIQIYDNVIRTSNSNSNLELRSYTGKAILAQKLKFDGTNILNAPLYPTENITLAGTHIDVSSANKSIRIPRGTTAERDTPAAGQIRYNTTDNMFEAYSTGWEGFNGLYSDTRATSLIVHPTADTIDIKVAGASAGTIDATKFTHNGLQVDGEVLVNGNIITTVNSNSDLEIIANGNGNIFTGTVMKFEDNKFINTVSDGNTQFASTGQGYYGFGGTTGIKIPVGTSAQRPDALGGSGVVGQLRYNTSTSGMEVYTGTVWENSAGFIETVPQNDAEDINFEQTLIFG